MNSNKRWTQRLTVIFLFGLIPALIVQFFVQKPVNRHIHITSFRYGKDPAVIRCNRGDTLHLTFSTNDTGHSFFLQEFDIDVKVSPSREEVEVFKTSDPTQKPIITKELVLVAKHPGIFNYLVSKSNYRCHVWCGPMHAFEQGKLIILPNTLLVFSLGCLLAIVLFWVLSIFQPSDSENYFTEDLRLFVDLFERFPLLKRIFKSRWIQVLIVLFAMMMIYVVILTSVFGTQMSGRNLGVLLMWAVWLFLLVAILTPFLGRIWCTICPLPFFGDLIQRTSFFTPQKGQTKNYHNKYSGLFYKWPKFLQNNWLKLFVFLALATFSTTLVAKPRVSGLAVIMLLLVPTVLSVFFELRAFCRYVCPVSVFIGQFSRTSPLALRCKSQEICDNCKPHYCEKGGQKGWACPYGLNVGKIEDNADCGLCMECLRSCQYDNVTLFKRPFAPELGTRNLSEAWTVLAVFTVSIVYSILYLGHWPLVRDYINILDKHNWDLFGIYTLILWFSTLVIMPAIVFSLSWLTKQISKTGLQLKKVFLLFSGALLPLGLFIWIAFVIPMFFVNITFIVQSFSDPFGWGWDFFGTSNIPWHQFMPRFIPWMQAFLILGGLYFSLRNLKRSFLHFHLKAKKMLFVLLPMGLFIVAVAVGMLFFFTN